MENPVEKAKEVSHNDPELVILEALLGRESPSSSDDAGGVYILRGFSAIPGAGGHGSALATAGK